VTGENVRPLIFNLQLLRSSATLYRDFANIIDRYRTEYGTVIKAFKVCVSNLQDA